MPRFFAAALAGACLLAGIGSARGAPIDPPFDLYDLGPLEAAEWNGLGASLGDWRILHQETRDGRTWALLALPEGARRSDVPSSRRPGFLGRVRPGERVVFLAPAERAEARTASGRSVALAPSGATVFITSDTADRLASVAHHSFRVVERSQPPPAIRKDRRAGGTNRFREMLERSRSPGGDTGEEIATADSVRALVNAVRADSLENVVRALSTLPSQEARSRYFARPETESVSRIYIASKLEEYLGPGSVVSQPFVVATAETTVTVTNVIGVLRCGLPDAGAVLVTAHYDAIGTRSDPVQLCIEGHRLLGSGCDCSQPASIVRDTDECQWNWRTDPAPGANDNATGVACVLEAARVLRAVPFEFDVYFIAFQGEELGLIGSAAFADSIADSDQEVYAVFNLDMIGYNSDRDRLDLVTNETSEWFADYITSTAQQFVPEVLVEKKVLFFGRSDHASFWSVGIDAVLLNEDIDVLYPMYHTFQDTWENTFPASGRPNSQLQLLLGGRLAVATLGRLAVHYDAPDLAIPAGELEAIPLSGGTPRAGSPIRLLARVHNLGASKLRFLDTTIDTLCASVTFFDGDPDAGGSEIARMERRQVFRAGGVAEFATVWTPPMGEEGFHEIHAIVEGLDPGYAAAEVSPANNEAVLSLFVEAPLGRGPRVLTQYPYPNPVRGTRNDIGFYYELTADATVYIAVYDLEAQLVGEFNATALFVEDGNQGGANRVSGSKFRWTSAEDTESGVYFYTIRVAPLQGGETTDQAKGKFALVR